MNLIWIAERQGFRGPLLDAALLLQKPRRTNKEGQQATVAPPPPLPYVFLDLVHSNIELIDPSIFRIFDRPTHIEDEHSMFGTSEFNPA